MRLLAAARRLLLINVRLFHRLEAAPPTLIRWHSGGCELKLNTGLPCKYFSWPLPPHESVRDDR